MRWLRRLFKRKHTSSRWDGTHATCSCGYSDVRDWDLAKHLKEQA